MTIGACVPLRSHVETRELFHLFRARCGRASAIRSPWSAARIWNAANTRGLAPAFTASIKHRVHFGISWHAPKMSEAIAPERASYRVAHGLLMFVAFGILFPIGGFLAQNGSIKCDDTALLCSASFCLTKRQVPSVLSNPWRGYWTDWVSFLAFYAVKCGMECDVASFGS